MKKSSLSLFIFAFVILLIDSLIVNWNIVTKDGIPAGDDVFTWLKGAFEARHGTWQYVWGKIHTPGMPKYFPLLQLLYLGIVLLTGMLGSITLVIRIMVFLMYFGSAISMFYFTYCHTKSILAGTVSALVLVSTRAFISPFLSGGYAFLPGYLLTPILFLALDRLLKRDNKRINILLFTMALALFFTSSALAYVFILSSFLILYAIFFIVMELFRTENKSKYLIGHFKSLTLSGLLFVFLSAFFLFSSLFVIVPSLNGSLGYTIQRFIGLNFSNQSILDAFFLRPYNRYWLLPSTFSDVIALIIVLLSFSVLLKRRNFHTVIFSLIALVSAFLAKGPNPPFGEVYTFLFNHFPFFNSIRPLRWTYMFAFSCSFLFGLTFKDIINKCKLEVPKKIRFKNVFNPHFLVVIFIILIVLVFPFSQWASARHTITTYTLPDEYMKPYEWLDKQKGSFTIATTPFLKERIWTPQSDWVQDFGINSPLFHGKSTFKSARGGGVEWNPRAQDLISFSKNLMPEIYEIHGIMEIGLTEKYEEKVITTCPKISDGIIEVEAKLIESFGNDTALSISFGYRNQSNFYFAKLDEQQDRLSLYKREGEKNTLIVSTDLSVNLDTWYKIRIVTYSSQTMIFVNDTLKIETVQEIFPEGRVALQSWGAQILFKNLRITSLDNTYYNFKSFLKVLSLFGVKYVLVQSYTDEFEKTFFTSQKGFKQVYTYGNAVIGRNENYIPLLYIPETVGLVLGGLKILPILASINDFNFNSTLLFFATDLNINEIEKIITRSNFIIFQDNNLLDLHMLMCRAKRLGIFINAGDYGATNTEDFSAAWVRSTERKRQGEFVFNRYVLKTGSSEPVKILFEVETKGTYDVWVRIYHSENPSKLEMRLDNLEKGTLYPQSSNRGFRWIKAVSSHLLNGRHELTLDVIKRELAVEIDQIAIVNSDSLNECQEITSKILNESSLQHVYIYNRDDLIKTKSYAKENESSEYITHELGVSMDISKSGYYGIAGHIADLKHLEKLSLELDDELTTEVDVHFDSSNDEAWFLTDPVYLVGGHHDITIRVNGRGVVIDTVLSYSMPSNQIKDLSALFGGESGFSKNVEFDKINPVRYTVHAKTSEPVFLVLLESFNMMWEAKTNEDGIQPFIAYGSVNAFYLENIIENRVTLYFKGQTIANIGYLISISSWFGVTLYLSVLLKEDLKYRLTLLKTKLLRFHHSDSRKGN